MRSPDSSFQLGLEVSSRRNRAQMYDAQGRHRAALSRASFAPASHSSRPQPHLIWPVWLNTQVVPHNMCTRGNDVSRQALCLEMRGWI